jgi:hypothetical protein
MKTKILLLITVATIFYGCGGGSEQSSPPPQGKCIVKSPAAIAFGGPGNCYTTTENDCISRANAKGGSYTFTPNGTCSN